jgi:hypothetical protein
MNMDTYGQTIIRTFTEGCGGRPSFLKTKLGLFRFCPYLYEPSLKLLGLDVVLTATTFTSADPALGGPHVFGSLLKHHCRQDRETGTPRSAAWNTPPTDYLEHLKHARAA